MLRSLARVTAIALAAAVCLTGCVTGPEIRLPDPEHEPLDQTLDWEPCGAVECATVTAPLDWASPGEEEIELALVRVPATGDSRGTILVNPGGPGGSGFDFVRSAITSIASPELRENYDFVGWDPRGVGRSSAVTCLDGDAKDALLFGDWTAEYGTEAWVDELEGVEEEFAAACDANTGPLLGFVDSVSTARDMDLMRELLGDEKLNYLGFSYGTYFGTVYAELFPERVGRLVLDGALDPTLTPIDWFTSQMQGFDSAAKAYLTDCVTDPACTFSGTPADAARQLGDLIESVDLRAKDGRLLDPVGLSFAIATGLYSSSNWPTLTAMFTEVEAGETDLAFRLLDSYFARSSAGEYSDNSFEVYTATLCLDSDLAGDDYDVASGLERIEDAAPLIGRYFAFDDYAHVEAACTAWPYGASTRPSTFDAAGAAPILVIGTTNDPATPYSWATGLADQLESGVLVTYTGEGHTIYGRGNSCIDDTVDAYFIDGTVPEADPDC